MAIKTKIIDIWTVVEVLEGLVPRIAQGVQLKWGLISLFYFCKLKMIIALVKLSELISL